MPRLKVLNTKLLGIIVPCVAECCMQTVISVNQQMFGQISIFNQPQAVGDKEFFDWVF